MPNDKLPRLLQPHPDIRLAVSTFTLEEMVFRKAAALLLAHGDIDHTLISAPLPFTMISRPDSDEFDDNNELAVPYEEIRSEELKLNNSLWISFSQVYTEKIDDPMSTIWYRQRASRGVFCCTAYDESTEEEEQYLFKLKDTNPLVGEVYHGHELHEKNRVTSERHLNGLLRFLEMVEFVALEEKIDELLLYPEIAETHYNAELTDNGDKDT